MVIRNAAGDSSQTARSLEDYLRLTGFTATAPLLVDLLMKSLQFLATSAGSLPRPSSTSTSS